MYLSTKFKRKYEVLSVVNYLIPVLLLQELFDLERWAQLVMQFRRENFQLHQLNDQSALAVTLQAGLSALKTPYPLVF